ncbi:MAG: tRNA 2-thiouridine(34) synthase MnmA [Parcubacteria group bacterium SW_6_46_9]|nr:MAG: tRNA 2-thiouridine(34) synthase MnmA [Parcubacteria group bacterium SW_6_46_9]
MDLPNHIKNIDNKSEKTVYVAMSGGVDSSTSAALLKQAGFHVVGCFMSVWQPPFLDCSMEAERQDAMDVAAQLGIDFRTVDLVEEYKNRVVDYMVSAYKSGRTPNPDVICNGQIKFGAFYEWAGNQGDMDYIATGHYARLRRETQNSKFKIKNSHLLQGVDEHKDQTYFLYRIGQKQLQDTLFPIGHLQKEEVRTLADELDVLVADKPDSQGLCFLGEVDMKDFLSQFIDLKSGNVCNEDGEVIGTHEGAEVYTIGQRRGFEVTKKEPSSGPWYVIDKNIQNNTITLTENNSPDGPVYNGKEITLTDTNWITSQPTAGRYKARIRYNQPLEKCKLKVKSQTPNQFGSGHEARVIFDKPLRAVASGQSCVVYDSEVCLGGGIIQELNSE